MRACFMEKERETGSEREKENRRERNREGEREIGREREKQGWRDSNREGERERIREKNREGGRKSERERDVEYVQNCLFLKGMTGALAPFSYLLYIECSFTYWLLNQWCYNQVQKLVLHSYPVNFPLRFCVLILFGDF